MLAVYDNAYGAINWREQHLYGSSRLGMWLPDINLATGSAIASNDTLGKTVFEIDNHLGNEMATITDTRFPVTSGGYFAANIVAAQDYYPFGMLMPGRQYTFGSDSTYRYGFNGKENNNEVYGLGNLQDYGSRFYDPQTVRFPSVDPIADQYPELSSYQFASNTPIQAVDLDGKEATFPVDVYVQAVVSSNGQPKFIDYAEAVATVSGNNLVDIANGLWNGLTGIVMSVPNLMKSTTNDIRNYQKDEAKYIMHRGQEYDQIKENGGDYNEVEKQHQANKFSNGLKIAKDYEDWFGLSVAGVELSATGVISITIPRQAAIDEIAGTFTNSEARQWYKKSISEIPDLLTKDASLEIQAKEASGLRNEFRSEARKLMGDRVRARHIEVEFPNRSWDQLVKKYSNQGYSGDDLYKKIIESSQRSNADIDKMFGLK